MLLVDWGHPEKLSDGKHTAVVHLHGTIEPKGDASAENIIGSLQSAFEDKGTAGVVLRINSPGGSPVQSGIINDEIKRFACQVSRYSVARWSRTCVLREATTLLRQPTAFTWTRPVSWLDRCADGRFRFYRFDGQSSVSNGAC